LPPFGPVVTVPPFCVGTGVGLVLCAWTPIVITAIKALTVNSFPIILIMYSPILNSAFSSPERHVGPLPRKFSATGMLSLSRSAR
jgi:hypothetical protein